MGFARPTANIVPGQGAFWCPGEVALTLSPAEVGTNLNDQLVRGECELSQAATDAIARRRSPSCNSDEIAGLSSNATEDSNRGNAKAAWRHCRLGPRTPIATRRPRISAISPPEQRDPKQFRSVSALISDANENPSTKQTWCRNRAGTWSWSSG